MRNGALVTCVLLVSACGIENEIRHTATLQSQTDGVVLSEDGFDSFAAMSGTTCTIDTAWGCPTRDDDLPTSEERLFDHYRGQTLGGSDLGVHTIDGTWIPALDMDIEGVHHAKLTDSGVVVLSGDEQTCVVQQGGVSTEVPGEACRSMTTIAVDRLDGSLLVGTPAGALRISDGVAVWQDEASDLVAFDSKHEGRYFAEQESGEIRAFDLTDELLWRVDTEGSVQSIAPRGDTGDLVALVKTADGFGAILRFDGETGKLLGSSVVPEGEGEIVVAENGHVVGIVREEEVHYYAFGIANEPEPVDPTPPESCMDGWNVTTRD